jgi:predicted nuclease with TOPRIM domain
MKKRSETPVFAPKALTDQIKILTQQRDNYKNQLAESIETCEKALNQRDGYRKELKVSEDRIKELQEENKKLVELVKEAWDEGERNAHVNDLAKGGWLKLKGIKTSTIEESMKGKQLIFNIYGTRAIGTYIETDGNHYLVEIESRGKELISKNFLIEII